MDWLCANVSSSKMFEVVIAKVLWFLWLPIILAIIIGLFGCLRRKHWKTVVLTLLGLPALLVALLWFEVTFELQLLVFATVATILVIRGKIGGVKLPDVD